jgi:ribose transport system permease protein
MPDVAATDETQRRPPGEEPSAGAGAKRTGVPPWQQFIAKYGVLVALVVTIIVFSALKPHVFPTGANLKAILEQFSPLAIIGFGLTVVLVMGDFDLSVPGMIGLGSAVVVALMSKHGVNYILAILIGLLVGVAGGAVNGVLVAFAGASSFIITLAMGQVFNGFEYLITKQETIFQGIPNAYTQIATGTFLGLSNQFFIMLGVLVIIYLLLEQSTIGRFMYALGGNQEAARLSGIRVRELRTLGFMITGVCSVIAGVLITSQNDSQQPNSGMPFFLPAFAAVFLGSAVLRPGRFNVLGTVVGAFFLEVISFGLTELSLSTSVILLVQGVILAAAVLLSRLGRAAT